MTDENLLFKAAGSKILLVNLPRFLLCKFYSRPQECSLLPAH
ncbi:hypothetical protein CLOM621_05447 [Clostridium sp. M62/1]|nr:hypothetical protein CLOM621_05447 [Clostridium sp. M62/1]